MQVTEGNIKNLVVDGGNILLVRTRNENLHVGRIVPPETVTYELRMSYRGERELFEGVSDHTLRNYGVALIHYYPHTGRYLVKFGAVYA